jgi:exonuclease VII small subunit
MDPEEKRLRLEAIEMALEDINKIIETMEDKKYPVEQVNEYYKKRWELWNEQYRTKKA